MLSVQNLVRSRYVQEQRDRSDRGESWLLLVWVIVRQSLSWGLLLLVRIVLALLGDTRDS